MREVLFRGKRVDDGEWVYGYLCVEKHPVESRHWIIIDLQINIVDGEGYRVIPETVGQFTGVNDEKGARIWEGDIIQCEIDNQLAEFKSGVVQYNDDYGQFEVFDAFEDFPLSQCYCIQVIGNIHEKKGANRNGHTRAF